MTTTYPEFVPLFLSFSFFIFFFSFSSYRLEPMQHRANIFSPEYKTIRTILNREIERLLSSSPLLRQKVLHTTFREISFRQIGIAMDIASRLDLLASWRKPAKEGRKEGRKQCRGVCIPADITDSLSCRESFTPGAHKHVSPYLDACFRTNTKSIMRVR